MKRLLITLLAALFVGGAFAQSAFPDIPENHWAADAVDRISDLGIVIGFPDGTFRGNEAFTRYQAALVVSRMLDVVADEVDARFAMTDEDLASLRNAVQELASDVAAQGVRLSATESAVASLSDDVSANSARLDELESALEGAGLDDSVVRDLQNQLASQRVALDTAQAQAEAAEALANDALDVARAAAARARENAGSIAALNDIVQSLGNRITALEQGSRAPVAGVPGDLLDRVARNEADIANIREFTILLRRDQVALTDRVAALEASDAIQAAELATLDERVTALENNPLGLTGSITVAYRVERLAGFGESFDVDRAFGLNADRDMGQSTFSSGTRDLNRDGDTTDAGEFAQDRFDITGNDTPVNTRLDLSLGFGGFPGRSADGGFDEFEVVLALELERANNLIDDDGETFSGYVFTVDELTVTYDPIGGAPLTFTYGEELNTRFTPYVFQLRDEPGFIATVGAPDFLAFLDPTLTVAYSPSVDDDGDMTQAFKRAARLELSPLDGVTVGASFAQRAANAGDKDDVNADNVTTTVFGVDASVSVSIFDLAVEYANGSVTHGENAPVGAEPAEDDKSVLYATLEVDGSDIPVLNSLSANYRSIDPAWTQYGLVQTTGPYPFKMDQTGFGVEASLGLFILDVGAYFDTYSTTTPDEAEVTAFGVDVSADLFAGFSLTGFFSQVSANGETIDSVRSAYVADHDGTPLFAGDAIFRDDNYRTGFGVGLEHDGDAENALISGLNLEFAYEQLEADFSKSRIFAAADYELGVAFLNLSPYVSFENISDSDEILTSDTEVKTELKVGTGLQTDPFAFFLAPSLEAAVNYRNADYAEFTSNEFQWSVGLTFNEFLFDNSTLAARYGSWTGTNMSTQTEVTYGGTTYTTATQISRGDVNNGSEQFVNGYEVEWNYFDLTMAYGVYSAQQAADEPTSGQAFRISYKVEF